MTNMELTLPQLKKKVKALGKLSDEKRNGIICTLIGHSRISNTCFGYRHCARCGDLLGDSLASVDYGIKEAVIIGHGCPECKANFKECTWKDKLFVRNPFAKNCERSKYLEVL